MVENLLKGYHREAKYIIEKDVVSNVKNPNILGRFNAVLSKSDEKTQNGTFYSRDLWESVIKSENFQDKLSKKLIMGEIDHPADPETSIKRVSHSVINVWTEGNEVWGKCEVFNTPNGQILWTLLNAGVQMGISSRALGEEEFSEGVKRIKKEGFNLIGWDAVVEPSAFGAGFKSFSESKKNYIKESLSKVDSSLAKQIVEEVEKKSDEIMKLENRQLKKLYETSSKATKNLQESVESVKSENKTLNESVKNLNKRNQEMVSVLESKELLISSKEKTIKSLNESLKKTEDKLKLYETELIEKQALLDSKEEQITKLNESKKSVAYNVVFNSQGNNLKTESTISRNISKSKPIR